MAYSLKAHGPIATGTSPYTTTLPGSYSTQAGDCIVVITPIVSGDGASVSGCGATWVSNLSVSNGGVSQLAVVVGYGCTAGGTSIVITAESNYCAVIGVFSGVLSSGNPIRNVVSVGSSNATPALTYTAGDLLIGAAGELNGQTWNTPGVWSNGGTDNSIDLASGSSFNFRSAFGTFQVSSSGTSTTYHATPGGSTNHPCEMAMSLIPLPSGPAPQAHYLELSGVLNQLAGTTGLGEAGAANKYAGTTGLEVVGALNAKAGNTLPNLRDFDGVCNQLAGTSGCGGVGALNKLAGNTPK